MLLKLNLSKKIIKRIKQRTTAQQPMKMAHLFSSSMIIFSLALLSITALYNRKMYKIDRDGNHNNPLQVSFACRGSPRWYQVLARKIRMKRMKIGLLHVTNGSFGTYDLCGEDVDVVNIHFQHVSMDVKWNHLFPEWVDETLPWDSSKCPHIPMPKFEHYNGLDIVVADVSCSKAGRINGRDFGDVFRLQVNLVVANLLARSGRKNNGGLDNQDLFAVFIGSCGPQLEIFRCDDLFFHEGSTSIYKPDLRRLMQKVQMPVGSCQLAPPFPKPGQDARKNEKSGLLFPDDVNKTKEAYVTVLHSSEDYVCGAIVLAQSIIRSNSTKDLILLADDSISLDHLLGLKAAGWKIKLIKRIHSPYAESESYNEWNYSKLRIWQLTEYEKLIFIDSDFIILRNTDKFFVYPQLSAVGNSRYIFNSGFMLVEPSNCMFRTLMKHRFRVRSYNGGDQGFLNEIFMWWHRWPNKLNFLKDFNPLPDFMHEVIPEDVYALHYLGFKPWMCRRADYDCNRDVPENKRFASDFAHRLWWRVHDSMTDDLKGHCLLTPEMEERKKMHIARAA